MEATRSRFLDLLGESLQVLLDYQGPQFTGALSVHINVRDGEPESVTVGREEGN